MLRFLGTSSQLPRFCNNEFASPDGFAVPIENEFAAVRLRFRPIEPGLHVRLKDGYSASVAGLCLGGLEGNESVLPIDLLPSPCEQLTLAHSGEVGRHKERLQVVRQGVAHLGVPVVA